MSVCHFISLALFFSLFSFTVQQQLSISLQDRLALHELRSSLRLRSKDWPSRSDPCFSWKGVECSNNGRVIGINISGFRRTRVGTRHPRCSINGLRNLTNLVTFNASSFVLNGELPQWFGLQMKSLRVLDLRSSLVSGTIPFSLGNVSGLVELYLSDNKLSGVVPLSLGQLVNLSVLDVSRNSLTGWIPDSFGSLVNLGLLDMSLNFLSGEIPPVFGALSALQVLNLSMNNFSSIPAEIGNLLNLVDIDLGFNALSGSVPSDFRDLVNLRRLIIGNNFLSGSLSSDTFQHMSQLEFVVLSHNGFYGDFPNVLWSIPTLRFLDASENNFTGLLPNASPSVNAKLASFNISNNLFYGSLTPVIGGFGFLDMSGNYFEGPISDYLHGNASLPGNCLRNLGNQRNKTDCALFYANRNLVFDNFGEPNAVQPPPTPSSSRNQRLVIILASVLASICLVVALVALILVLLLVCNRKSDTTNQRSIEVGHVSTGETPPPPATALNFSNLGDSFTYQEIFQSTDEFKHANLIKSGHSGDLFRGILEGGIEVVIKKVDLIAVAKKEAYLSELNLFSKISNNPRFVPLLGHFLKNENDKYIVYKYMPNGDLSSSLLKKTSLDDDSLQSLDWITRLKIATEAAEGLTYLHHECIPPLVHRGVQASSIFLDDKFGVRLGSLSEVCPQEGEIHQSMITRFLRLPQTASQGASGVPNATCAYDVYCFGKVLLELVTGKLGISSSTDATTKDWLEATLRYISIYNKELVTKIMDPLLIIDEDLLEEVWAMALVARSCLNPKPNRRPLMRYILKALENPLKVVREENTISSPLRTTSSRGSWNAALFGSWRYSFSDVGNVGTSHQAEDTSSLKLSGTTDSQGSSANGHSSSMRRQSNNIFPLDEHDVQRK